MAHQTAGMTAYVTTLSPEPEIKDPVDTSPSDIQPPGVDEDIDYNTLEEALTSWEGGEHLNVGLPFHWLWPSTLDTLSRLDGGKDHNKAQKISAENVYI